MLKDDGIVVAQGESPFYLRENQKGLLKVISSVFPIAMVYNFHNFSYPGGHWSFIVGSKKWHPLNDFDPLRVEDSGLDFSYYNTDIHRAAFALPTYQREFLKEHLKEG